MGATLTPAAEAGEASKESGRVELLLLAVLIVGSFGCSASTEPGSCTPEYVYGLHIEVRDALTHERAAFGATIVARDGAYTDTLEVMPGGLLALGAGERAGIYVLTIEKTGYQMWQRTDIRVQRDLCHVHPVLLQVEIQPLGDGFTWKPEL